MQHTMARYWVMFVAQRAGRPVGCSLLAIDPDRRHAYGRYWGCTEYVRTRGLLLPAAELVTRVTHALKAARRNTDCSRLFAAVLTHSPTGSATGFRMRWPAT
jgi:hypothetical protein